jgi:hypothetical protein
MNDSAGFPVLALTSPVDSPVTDATAIVLNWNEAPLV